MAAANRANNDNKVDSTMLNDNNIVEIKRISEDSALEAELGISFEEAYEQYMCARLGLEKGSLVKYSVQELEEEIKFWTGRETEECIKFLQNEINRRNSDEAVEKFDPKPLEVMDEYLAKLTYLEMSGEADGRESEGRLQDMLEYVTDDDLQFVANGCECIVDTGEKRLYPHKDMLVIKRRYYYVCAQAAAVAHNYGNDAWFKATLRAVNEANEGHRIEAHFANDVLEVVCHTETPKGEDKEFMICMNVKFKQIKHSTFVEPRTNVRFNFDLQMFAQPDGVDDGADRNTAVALVAKGMATFVKMSAELMAQVEKEYDVFSIASNEEGGVYMNGHDVTIAKIVAQIPIGREEVDLLLTELQQAKHPVALRSEDHIKTVILGKHTFRLEYSYVSHRRDADADHTVVHTVLFNASDSKMAAKIHWNLKYEQPVVVCATKKDAHGKPYKYYGQHRVAQEVKKAMVPMLTALAEQNVKHSHGVPFMFDLQLFAEDMVDDLQSILKVDGNRKIRFYRDADIEVDDPYGLEDDHFSELCGVTEDNEDLFCIHWDGTKHQQYIQCRASDGTRWAMDLSDQQLGRLLNQFEVDHDSHKWNIESFGYATWNELDENYDAKRMLKEYLSVLLVDDAAQAEASTEETAVVSESMEDASQNTTESSTNAEAVKEDAQTAESINKKEVNYSAVEALLSKYNMGGIDMDTILIQIAERNARHAGTHRYETMRNFDTVKATEVVGAVMKWYGRHKKHSTGFKMASVRNLVITPNNSLTNGFSVTALLIPKQANDMNADLVEEGVAVRAMTGMAALPRKRYMRHALTLNIAGIASKPAIAQMMSTASWAVVEGENTVDIYCQQCSLAAIEDADGTMHTTVKHGAWMHITGKIEHTINEDGTMSKKGHYPVVEDLPDGAEVYYAWSNCATVSEKRQGRIPLYAMSEDEFFARRNVVTRGESVKRLNGEKLSVKDGANLVARLSSHDTATMNGVAIDCLAVLNMKRTANDGSIIYNANFWPEREGKFGQGRPVTIKGAGAYLPGEAVNLLMSTYTWKVFVRDELVNNPELTAELDAVLNPTVGLKTDYDGVIICDNVLQIPQVIATLDGCKDLWNYEVVDHENTLRESEDVEKAQHLSSQMFRKLAAAGAKSGKFEEAMDIAREAMREDILSLFKEFTSEAEHDSTFKFSEKITEQQVAVIARKIGADLRHYPYLYRRAIEDFLKTLSKKILLGSYEVPGFYTLVQPDFCAWLKKNEHRILHIGLENGKPYVEVYASGCEGRAVLFKYPCVGNHEFVLVKFVTLDELLKRIDELNGISDAEREFLRLTYKALKPGTLTIAAYDVVAKVLAGFDYDGDEAMVITAARFVTFFWENAESVAVDICPDKVKMDTVIADKWLSAWMQKANAALGNASVGAVTNMGAIFSNFEIMLWASSMTSGQKKIMRTLMEVLGNQETLGLVERGVEYVSPIPVRTVNGFKTYTVTNAIVDEVLRRMQTMHPSVANLKRSFADMDKVFRFWQELTIDAVKKIFKIVIAFKDALVEAGIAITITRHGIEFDMTLDTDRKVQNITLADVAAIADSDGAQLGDVMYPIRKEAVEIVMKKMVPIVTDYNNAVATLLQERELKQQAWKDSDDQLFFAVNVMGRYVRAMNDYNAYRTSQLIRTVNWKSLGHKTQNALMTEINASMKHEMRDLYSAVSNTLRRMAAKVDAGTPEIAERMAMVTVGDGAIGQLCNEEVKSFFLDKEDVVYTARIHLFDDSMSALVSDYVIVSNGIAHSTGGQVGYCSAPNGYYAVRDINDKLYAVQYASEDIEVPEIDNTRVVIMIEGNSNVNTALKSFRENGRNVGFKLVKTSNGSDALRMFDEKGTACAWVVANSASAKAGWLPMAQLLIDLVNGKKFRCETIVSVPGTDKKQKQLLLVLDEIGTFELPQKEEKKEKTAPAPVQSGTDDVEAEMLRQADEAIAALCNLC